MKKKLMLLLIIYSILMAALYLPRKKYSAFENRFLETFEVPELKEIINLKWMDQFETAMCEQFNLRNISITIKTYCDHLLGRKDNGRVYFGKENYLMKVEDTRNSYLEANVNALNELAKQGTPIDFIPIYTSFATLQSLRPNFTETQQHLIMDYMKNNLENIKLYDSWDILKEQKEYYYKTDHHWTMLGAKAVYEFYMNKTSDENLEIVKDDFLGTLYYQAPTLNSVSDDILTTSNKEIIAKYSNGMTTNSYYSEKHLGTNDAYRYYLDGNYERIDIETQTKNGKSILVVKDSYANCFVPFLNEDYQYITIIDMRYGSTNLINVLNEGYQRCLFLYEINQFSNDEYLSRGNLND